MKFSPGAFNGLLRTMGQAVTWQQAALCPCRDPISGAPRVGCPACLGKGVTWAPAVPAWTGVASMRVAREWAAFGQWESGDEVLSIPADSPLYAAGEYDRIVMTDSSEPFSLVLIRGENDVLHFAVVTIDRCSWLTPDGGDTVIGGIPVVAADGSLSWPPGALAPDAGVQYSLSGRRHQEYFVFRDLVQERAHFGGQALPRRVVARRFDLLGR